MSRGAPRERPMPPRRLLWLVAGFVAWSFAFVALYGLHAIGCAFGWPAGLLRLALVAVLLAHLGVITWMWRRLTRMRGAEPDGDTSGFLRTVFLWTTIAALAATVFSFGPGMVLTVCV